MSLVNNTLLIIHTRNASRLVITNPSRLGFSKVLCAKQLQIGNVFGIILSKLFEACVCNFVMRTPLTSWKRVFPPITALLCY